MQDWIYAELSSAAKKAGGPEKLVDQLIKAGKNSGHKEMIPFVAVALVTGVVGGTVGTILVKYIKKKKKTSLKEVAAAKAKLIQGIKDYDAAHPEEKESTTSGEGEENEEKRQ